MRLQIRTCADLRTRYASSVLKRCFKTEIVLAGSSGGALAAALKLAESGARGNIVVVFPDRGDRYFSKGLYDFNEI